MIKAIETVYNGYKFRSRLEARWAVFFDELGIRYQYEIEGYKIKDIGNYLPDFFLPEDEIYIEIKPTINNQTWKQIRKDHKKWLNFREDIDKKLVVFFGEPFPFEFDVFFSLKGQDDNLSYFFWRNTFFLVSEDIMLLAFEPKKTDPEARKLAKIWGVPDNTKDPILTTALCHLEYAAPPGDVYQPIFAYTAARQARFEHH